MPKPRYRLVDTAATPYYHCVSRCVRRAFLCGVDQHTGSNFDHRKQWLIDRIRQLSSVFSIDVCAFAVMSNHFHLVVHIDVNRAEAWSDKEVVDRWLTLYSGPELAHRYRKGEATTLGEESTLDEMIAIWRSRLANLSWYMRCLNETIARMANHEDDCTGRFWEGRFRSQALLDNVSLVACMAYVDLNPVRAGLCESLLESDFTSIQERLREYAQIRTDHVENEPVEDRKWLLPFADEKEGPVKLPFTSESYFELADWTGRVVRKDNKGFIPRHVPPLLKSLGVKQEYWAGHVQKIGRTGVRASGKQNLLRVFALKHRQKWLSGQSLSEILYNQ